MAPRPSALIASCTLVALALAPTRAAADGFVAPAAGPPTVALPPPPAITAEQLDAFVELTREPKPWVWYRLVREPDLVPYAVAAADARLERRATGRRRATVGFTLLGVGSIIGAGLWLKGLQENIGCGEKSGCGASRVTHFGLPLMLMSIAIGGGLGISGIATASGTSQTEHQALVRYRTPPAPLPATTPDPRVQGRATTLTLHLPLLSLTF
jgi:hypothetical protein